MLGSDGFREKDRGGFRRSEGHSLQDIMGLESDEPRTPLHNLGSSGIFGNPLQRPHQKVFLFSAAGLDRLPQDRADLIDARD